MSKSTNPTRQQILNVINENTLNLIEHYKQHLSHLAGEEVFPNLDDNRKDLEIYGSELALYKLAYAYKNTHKPKIVTTTIGKRLILKNYHKPVTKKDAINLLTNN